MNTLSKRLLIVLLAAALGVVSTSVAGDGASPKGKPFVAINDQVIQIEGAVSSLQGQIDQLVARVDTMEQRVDANQAAISTLQDENAALEFIAQQNTSDIASIKSQIDNNTNIIAALQNEINIINDKLVLKQNLINGICPDGNAIQQILTDGSVVCEGVGGTSGQLQSVHVYQYRPANSHSTISVYANCPAGYTVTGAGFQGTNGWAVLSSNTGSDNNNDYSYLKASNNNPYLDGIFNVATCSRIVP